MLLNPCRLPAPHPAHLLIAIGVAMTVGGLAAADPAVLTSDCADGEAVCWIEPASPEPAAPGAASLPEAIASASAPATAAGGVLSLTNADIGATQVELAARIAPTPVVAEPTDGPDATEAVVSERWGASVPPADEVWTSADGDDRVVVTGAAQPPLDFSTCMEKAIRGEVAFVPARRVCEILFPDTASAEVE